MKSVSSKRTRWHFLAGVAGLVLCVLLFLYAQYGLDAPNRGTLVYNQNIVTAFIAILLLFSLIALGRGVRNILHRRRMERLNRDR